MRVFVADEQSDRPVDLGRFGELAERVLSDRGIAEDAELNVLFVDEASIAALNERFLQRQGPTDVLSFPIEDDLGAPGPPPAGQLPDLTGPGREGLSLISDGMPLMLGDVVICPAVAWRNAPEHAGNYEDELALLIVHGILHLLGMDHEVDAEAEEMEALEKQLLGRLYSGSGSASGAAPGSDAGSGAGSGAAPA